MKDYWRTLALDCATATGWALRSNYGTLDSGTYVVPGDTPEEKLGNFLVWLEGMVPAESVAIEKPWIRGKGSFLLIGFASIACAVAKKKGLTFHEYPPKTVKKAITGSGDADKKAVRKMVIAMTKADPQSDDESDAIAVLLCHENRAKRERPS